MKRTETFKTSVEDLVCGDEGYNRAEIGWALEIGLSESGVAGMQVKVLHATLYGNEPDKRLNLDEYSVKIISDYCIGIDKEFKPEKVVADLNRKYLQIDI